MQLASAETLSAGTRSKATAAAGQRDIHLSLGPRVRVVNSQRTFDTADEWRRLPSDDSHFRT